MILLLRLFLFRLLVLVSGMNIGRLHHYRRRIMGFVRLLDVLLFLGVVIRLAYNLPT